MPKIVIVLFCQQHSSTIGAVMAKPYVAVTGRILNMKVKDLYIQNAIIVVFSLNAILLMAII